MVYLGPYNDDFYSRRMNDLSDLKLVNTWALGNCNLFLKKVSAAHRGQIHMSVSFHGISILNGLERYLDVD